MPATDYMDLELAFEASSLDGGLGECRGYLNVETGAVHCRFPDDCGEGLDPADLDEPCWHVVPSRHDLDLGRVLVDRFIDEEIPAHADAARQLWHGRGAWQRWKTFLDRHGLLDRWRSYEQEATVAALVEWCAGLGVEVTGVPR